MAIKKLDMTEEILCGRKVEGLGNSCYYPFSGYFETIPVVFSVTSHYEPESKTVLCCPVLLKSKQRAVYIAVV